MMMTRTHLAIMIISILIANFNCTCSRIKYKVDFPEFPLPPPQPSASDEIPRSYFSDCKTIEEVNIRIVAAMDQCGYARKSYYYVPDGFAVVTQLEKINSDGSSKPENERWNVNTVDRRSFTIMEYLASLFRANPGFYRTIAFVITDTTFGYSKRQLTRQKANDWLNGGINTLPKDYGKTPVTENHTYTALIYEFRKNENEDTASLMLPSDITGRRHLEKSRITENLKTPK